MINNDQLELFEHIGNQTSNVHSQVNGKPRLKRACRDQHLMNFLSIDEMISETHIVRTIWDLINQLDLSPYLNSIKSVEGCVGRPKTDPKILLCLWVYATLEGIGSARSLTKYCKEHLAFIWICGGVQMNEHTLSDFRNEGDKLEQLLTQLITVLIHQDIVSTDNWAQDGMRVRASAGKGSFRRKKTLNESKKIAKKRVKDLAQELKTAPTTYSLREKAAKERAAKERLENVTAAIENLKTINNDIDNRAGRGKKERRELKKKSDPLQQILKLEK